MVEDQRGMVHTPAIYYQALGIPVPSVEFTQARKEAWIERLESASSEKALGKLHSEDGNAACALGHLHEVDGDDNFVVPTWLYKKIVKMNDEQDMSLPEIAIWVKENVEVTD